MYGSRLETYGISNENTKQISEAIGRNLISRCSMEKDEESCLIGAKMAVILSDTANRNISDDVVDWIDKHKTIR